MLQRCKPALHHWYLIAMNRVDWSVECSSAMPVKKRIFLVFLWQLTLTVFSRISLGAHTFILRMVCKQHSLQQRAIMVCSIYACPSIDTRAWCACALGHYGEQAGVQLLPSIYHFLLRITNIFAVHKKTLLGSSRHSLRGEASDVSMLR